jgi:hypothetical protein
MQGKSRARVRLLTEAQKKKRCQHVEGSDLESSHHTRSNPGVIHEAPQITAMLPPIVNPNPTRPPIQIYHITTPSSPATHFNPPRNRSPRIATKNTKKKTPHRSPNQKETQPQQITRHLRHPALLRGRSPADQRGGEQLRPVKPANQI